LFFMIIELLLLVILEILGLCFLLNVKRNFCKNNFWPKQILKKVLRSFNTTTPFQ